MIAYIAAMLMHIAALSFFWGVLLISVLVIKHTIKN
jgi:hypothetical protein